MLNLLYKQKPSDSYNPPLAENSSPRLTPETRVVSLPKLLAGLIMLAVAAVFVGYSFSRSQNQTDETSLAVLTPETSYTRIRPANPEGMAIPDQDKLVYRSVNPEIAMQPETDTVLPTPEQPLNNTAQNNNPQDNLSSHTYTVLKPLSATKEETETPEKKTNIIEVAPKIEKKIEKKAEQAIKDPATAIITKKLVPPAVVRPIANGAYRVQLVASNSEAQANTTWDTLRNRVATLNKAKKFIEPVTTAKGTFYRLQAGSWANRADAVRVCQELQIKAIDCVVVQR